MACMGKNLSSGKWWNEEYLASTHIRARNSSEFSGSQNSFIRKQPINSTNSYQYKWTYGWNHITASRIIDGKRINWNLRINWPFVIVVVLNNFEDICWIFLFKDGINDFFDKLFNQTIMNKEFGMTSATDNPKTISFPISNEKKVLAQI